jgi:hypothetical protein
MSPPSKNKSPLALISPSTVTFFVGVLFPIPTLLVAEPLNKYLSFELSRTNSKSLLPEVPIVVSSPLLAVDITFTPPAVLLYYQL